MLSIFATVALQGNSPSLESLMKQVDSDRMKAVVERLSKFHTRNTLSSGLTDSAEWVAAELRKIPGLNVELMKYVIEKGRRVPESKEVVQVVATLQGEDERVVLIGGHLDSLNLSVDAATGRAPGANDDASGVALTMELARVLSQRKWKHTLKFVAFSGEEQGLLGSRALANRAAAEKWTIEAVLSNDTVGSSSNKAGQKDTKRVRVFSDDEAGSESRELARYIEWIVRKNQKGFGIKLVFRKDRFGRGGDHTPFAELGYPAVRFIEVHEEFSRQHTPDDLSEYMDWSYLANVAKANLIALSTLAQSGSAPTNVKVDMRQGHDTTLTWKASPGTKYNVYWRETTEAIWHQEIAAGAVETFTVKGVNKDDHIFAVGAECGVPVLAR